MIEVSWLYRIKFKYHNFVYQIKNIISRAIRGYGDDDVIELVSSISISLEKILNKFKQMNIAMWYDKDNNKQLTFEETQAIIDKMIDLLHIMNDNWTKYSVFDDVDNQLDSIAKFEMRQHKASQEFWALFSKWYYDLWI